MSKSTVGASERGRINVSDSDDDIVNKCRKAVTDFAGNVTFDPDSRPGVANMVSIYAATTEQTVDEACDECRALDTLQFKSRLADVLVAHLSPIRRRYFELLADTGQLRKRIEGGNGNAKNIAQENLEQIERIIGLRR